MHDRSELMAKFRAMRDAGKPIIGGGAGTGLSAKCEEAGGIDLIVIYNSGRYRMAGRGSLAGLMPYGDANAVVMEMAGEVLPVVKHIPGHGRAGADTHHELPKVDASLAELEAHDFAPFKALADMPFAMTAHVVYSAIDGLMPATTSPAVIQDIIRDHIGFDGLLMSDDVSMQALSGDFRDRTDAIFAAGCDVILHCNGVMDEMQQVAAQTPVLRDKAETRANLALLRRERPDAVEETAARQEFSSLTGLPVEAA